MADWIGRTIGNYRVEDLLGAGGMGQVYRARHIHLGRADALKVLHTDFAQNENFVQRFRQEASTAAVLRHPNIVEVYDFGEQDSICYLAMELVTGGALRGLLRRRTEADNRDWNLPLGLNLVREAARALDFAHQHGVVHRDVKPDNILLVPQTNGSFAYSARLSDFGLARLAESSNLTATGTTMGTPAYISPEQCRGEEVDGRSDLYSLGIVLYEVATGLLPFAVKTLNDAVYKHVHTAPPPPRSIAPTISPELEAVILRCIAKSPADRFATGADLDAALKRIPEMRPAGEKETVVAKSPESGLETDAGPLDIDAGNAPPLVSVLGSSLLPRVQTLDAQGQMLGMREIGGDGLTLGRLPINDIMLDSKNVSRHHLRLDWDGTAVTVTDLGSSNGSFLAGRRLIPQTPTRWEAQEALQIGSFFLRLIPPMTANVAAGKASGVGTSPGNASGGGIGIVLDNETLSLIPGKQEALRITVANLGSQVEHMEVEVEGVPGSWLKKPSQPTRLNPGTQATIPIGVEAPRTAQSRVGVYPITLRVRSRETPERFGEASGSWKVLPFDGAVVTMAPLKKGGATQAKYTLTLRNEGNADAHWDLKATDDEQAMTYGFDPPQLSIAPGGTADVHLTVQAERRWLGTPLTRPFTIRATVVGDTSASGSAPPLALAQAGQFVHHALLPPWVPAVVLAVLTVTPFAWKSLSANLKQNDPLVIVTPGPSTSPTDSPVVTPSPVPTGTPRPDRSADVADVQLVALGRLKFIRDQVQRTQATLLLVKDVPPVQSGIGRYRDRYGFRRIVPEPQLSEAEKVILTNKIQIRTIGKRRVVLSNLSPIPIPRFSPLPLSSPAPTVTPPPPDLSEQQVAVNRMNDLQTQLAQTWGAIIAMGLGQSPSTANFNLDSAGTLKGGPENMQSFGVPRFNALGLKDLYSRLLIDLYTPDTEKEKHEEEFGALVSRYAHPDQYPLAPLYPHISVYSGNPASIGMPEYKEDMQQIEEWLKQVEQDVNDAESHFH